MLSNMSKALLSVPLVVFICSIFAVVNGMTIPSEMLLICTAGFAAILCLLLNVIFTLLGRILQILHELYENEDKEAEEKQLEDFLKVVAAEVKESIRSNKD